MNKAQLQELSDAVKNETSTGANTAERVGTLTESIIQNMGLSSDYRVVAGVIRNTGSGWFAIDDIDHEPLNITSVSNTDQSITIGHSIGASKVVSLLACPDETYANQYNFGTSVGLDSSQIRVTPSGATLSVNVTHTGNGVFTLSSNMSGVSYVYDNTNGRFTLTHPRATGATRVDDWQGDTMIMGGLNTLNYTNVYRKFYDLDGTQQDLLNPSVKRFTIERKIDIETVIDPDTLVSSFGNVWIIGILKVQIKI